MVSPSDFCPRCDAPLAAFTMSMFNTEIICLSCKAVEAAHPRYPHALAAEAAAVAGGDMNFPGIGVPDDLVRNPIS